MNNQIAASKIIYQNRSRTTSHAVLVIVVSLCATLLVSLSSFTA